MKTIVVLVLYLLLGIPFILGFTRFMLWIIFDDGTKQREYAKRKAQAWAQETKREYGPAAKAPKLGLAFTWPLIVEYIVIFTVSAYFIGVAVDLHFRT